jgi:hypothetical protein
VEAKKLFDNIVTNLGVSIFNIVKVQSLENFISHWKLELWKSLFYREFKLKGGILKNKTWQQQIGGEEALK